MRADAKSLLQHKLLNQVDKSELEKIISNGSKLQLPKELTSTIKKHLDEQQDSQR